MFRQHCATWKGISLVLCEIWDSHSGVGEDSRRVECQVLLLGEQPETGSSWRWIHYDSSATSATTCPATHPYFPLDSNRHFFCLQINARVMNMGDGTGAEIFQKSKCHFKFIYVIRVESIFWFYIYIYIRILFLKFVFLIWKFQITKIEMHCACNIL
jgi:hypothetical protein